MSRIKEFYHEEICQGMQEPVDIDYFIEKEKKETKELVKSWGCDGFKTSNCCGANLEYGDICCDCGDHANTSCSDCDEPCEDYFVLD
jgi:hypothetical protein